MSCVVTATVYAAKDLWKIAIKEDWYQTCYHSKEARRANSETMYRVCKEIV